MIAYMKGPKGELEIAMPTELQEKDLDAEGLFVATFVDGSTHAITNINIHGNIDLWPQRTRHLHDMCEHMLKHVLNNNISNQHMLCKHRIVYSITF